MCEKWHFQDSQNTESEKKDKSDYKTVKFGKYYITNCRCAFCKLLGIAFGQSVDNIYLL